MGYFFLRGRIPARGGQVGFVVEWVVRKKRKERKGVSKGVVHSITTLYC